MNLRFPLSTLFAALVLAGCAAPDFHQPEVATPTAFKESQVDPGAPAEAGGAWKLAQPAETQARGTWWQAFADPSLDALETEAIGANADLAAAAARVTQARALLRTAEADRSPQVGAGVGGQRGQRSGASLFLPEGQTGPTGNFFQAGLSASYEVDLFGRVRNNIGAARADAQATEATYRSVLLALQADVAQTYFRLRATDAEHDLLAATVKLRDDNVKLVQSRFDAGDVGEIDLRRAKVDRSTAESDRIALERQRAVLEHALAVLLGRAAGGFSFPADPLLDASRLPVIPEGIPSALLERRPDIATAQNQMIAANARIGVARAARFPAIALTGQGGYESFALGDLFQWSSRTWLLGVVANLPIIDGGRNRANIRRAEAVLEESVNTYRQRVLVAFAEVEDNLAGLRTLAGQSRTTDEAVVDASRAADLAEKRYRAGQTSYLESIDAQRDLLAVQRQAVQLRGQRATTTVALVRALGGGWGPVNDAAPPLAAR